MMVFLPSSRLTGRVRVTILGFLNPQGDHFRRCGMDIEALRVAQY